jgi:hypothetical protein
MVWDMVVVYVSNSSSDQVQIQPIMTKISRVPGCSAFTLQKMSTTDCHYSTVQNINSFGFSNLLTYLYYSVDTHHWDHHQPMVQISPSIILWPVHLIFLRHLMNCILWDIVLLCESFLFMRCIYQLTRIADSIKSMEASAIFTGKIQIWAFLHWSLGFQVWLFS